ncbi:MAG: fibronectin type III domain-containing protein, partial [bacterium]
QKIEQPPPPAAPTSLAASTVSGSQINLTWQDKATNETGYKVERKTGSTGTWGEIASLGTNASSYSNTGLTDGTRYYYRVYAYNSAGNSGYSNEANDTTPMNAPSNLIATAVSSSQINLNWQDNSGSESGYRIERKTGAGGTYSEITTLGANVTSYSNTGLSESTTYYYRVQGYNSLVTSTYSNEEDDTTTPVELISFSGRIINNRIVVLEWVTATESNNHGFEIERKLQSDSAGVETEKWYKIGFVPGSGTTAIPHGYRFEDKSLTVPGTYCYHLKQLDRDGSFNYSPVVIIVVEAPRHFVLWQNLPNPFNSETTIKYQLSKRTLVMLTIYNALGQEIRRLVNEEKEVGYHQIRWNGKDNLGHDVASGIYLYCLEVDDFIATQKMILMW